MAITSIWCCSLQADVTRVTNLKGEIVCVVCSELETAMNTCRVKTAALQRGPLSLLFDCESDTPSSQKPRCTVA